MLMCLAAIAAILGFCFLFLNMFAHSELKFGMWARILLITSAMLIGYKFYKTNYAPEVKAETAETTDGTDTNSVNAE